MAFFSIPSSLKISAISITLLSTFIYFIIIPPHSSSNYPSPFPIIPKRSLLNSTTSTSSSPSCSSIYQTPIHLRCSFSKLHCHGDSDGLINYFSLHFCIFHETPFLSLPCLSLILILQFYILVKTAQDRFSVVVTKLYTHLKLTPSIGAVTLLALGNGAPDVFASVAAVRGGHARTGFGAILSAGTFVSAFVVGFVAIYAAPFSVNPATFVRDVLFYLISALFLFYVYLSAEIYLWQAVGFVGFYLFFVGFVFWMDLGMEEEKKKSDIEVGLSGEDEVRKGLVTAKMEDCEMGESVRNADRGNTKRENLEYGFRQVLQQV